MPTNWQSEVMAAIELTVMDAGMKLILPTAGEANDLGTQGTAYIAEGFHTRLSFHYDFGPEDCRIILFPPGQSPHATIGFVHAPGIREFAAAYHNDGREISDMLAFIKEYITASEQQKAVSK